MSNGVKFDVRKSTYQRLLKVMQHMRETDPEQWGNTDRIPHNAVVVWLLDHTDF